MGGGISALRSKIQDGDDELKKKSVEELDVLQELVGSRLDKYQAELNAGRFSNAEAIVKGPPGIRPLRWDRRMTCRINGDPARAVHSVVDEFFGLKGSDASAAVAMEFKNLVSATLKPFLNDASAGQHEEEKFFIFVYRNVVVRVDVKLYRWNFEGEGLFQQSRNCLGYILCLSLVDTSKLKTSEFVFVLSEYTCEMEVDIVKYTNAMAELYGAARKMRLAAQSVKRDEA